MLHSQSLLITFFKHRSVLQSQVVDEITGLTANSAEGFGKSFKQVPLV